MVHITNQDPTLVSKPQWQDIANNLYILSSASAAPTLLAYGTCGCVSALRNTVLLLRFLQGDVVFKGRGFVNGLTYICAVCYSKSGAGPWGL